MRKETIAGRKVILYDSIDELPVKRFHKYNKFMLIDSGVGSTLSDINAHIKKIQGYMSKDLKLAGIELDNLRQNMYLISQELGPKYLSFAALVHSIDGKEVFDLSDDNLKAIVDTLATEKVTLLDKLISGLKKKLKAN